MSDLLKEAIADAKTVRETAIANAKMALEEAFTPHLKSMLSAKLKEDEFEDEEELEVPGEVPGEEEDAEDMARSMYRDDEMPGEEELDGGLDVDITGDEPDVDVGDDDEEMAAEEGVIEINGVKYAPVVSEEEEEIPGDEEGEMDNLDLEAVIKELEQEISEQDDAYDEKAPSSIDGLAEQDDAYPDRAPSKSDVTGDKVDGLAEEEELEEDEDKIDEYSGTKAEKRARPGGREASTNEQSDSSNIGTGDNKVNQASAADEEDPGKGQVQESVNAMQKELNEYKEAVTFLREKLHEVNILNAKLLYTNRLFKEFALNNNQKLKIVETFDRAQTTREIKLVYSTLAESFANGDVKKARVQESASQKSGTTKPTQKIITEESQVADRFKKLAGIL